MSAMQTPILQECQPVGGGWSVLPAFLPVPGLGAIAVNSFLLDGPEPVLVDTGLAALGEGMLEALARQIDLPELRWIWLSHMDADHVGNLAALLERAPKARILTNFLGAGKLAMMGFDTARVEMLGTEPVRVGDRSLAPVRPAYYDAPETLGFFDTRARVLFSADSFGAVLEAPVAAFDEIGEAALGKGLALWSAIDAPWLASQAAGETDRALAAIEHLDPVAILSSHLPACSGRARELIRTAARALGRAPAATDDALSMDRLIA